MDNTGFLSIPALKQYLREADTLGVDYAAMLKDAGVTERELEDNTGRVSGQALERLLLQLIEAANDPCFGLRSSVFVQPATYSVVGYIALNCANLQEILDNIPIYERIVGDTGVTSIENLDRDHVLQRWDCRFQHTTVRRHLIENVLGSWQYYARHFLGFPPADSIMLEHEAPQGVDPSIYTEIFGCDVLFEQPLSGVAINRERLEHPVHEANPELLGTLLEHATRALKDVGAQQRISLRVRNLLRLSLRDGISAREDIARRLGMSGRTLQRKLISEGTHYQELLTQQRMDIAMHFLRNTSLTMDVIASRLGYDEVRSFYRSFRQWAGVSPGEYREKQ